MKNLSPLMQREWLQHRFAWAMLLVVPLALAVLPLSFGQIELDGPMARHSGAELATALGAAALVGTAAVLFLIVWIASMFMISGLARRDHGDRSVEFWLSLPTGHGESLAAPLLVHLLLVPAAALLAGLLAGGLISFVVVSRFVGMGEWFGLPWPSLLGSTLAVLARVLAGLPLATLWLMPLILLAILSNALFKRWGVPLLLVALGVGSTVLKYVFGQPIVGDVIRELVRSAGLSLVGASGVARKLDARSGADVVLAAIPGWAAQDLIAALGLAASPLFLGALLASAGLFFALVRWRMRGASHGH